MAKSKKQSLFGDVPINGSTSSTAQERANKEAAAKRRRLYAIQDAAKKRELERDET